MASRNGDTDIRGEAASWLQAALEENTFSTLDPTDQPVALSQINGAARQSPKELMQESFGFSIVARNENILW